MQHAPSGVPCGAHHKVMYPAACIEWRAATAKHVTLCGRYTLSGMPLAACLAVRLWGMRCGGMRQAGMCRYTISWSNLLRSAVARSTSADRHTPSYVL